VAVSDIRIGTQLAGYRLEKPLGLGATSVVYLAEDTRLKRKVALKLLAPELADDERFRERFLRESEIAASLDHPNIVPIYEAGAADRLLYIAMRYVEGSDLRVLLRDKGALESDVAVSIVSQLADALDAAHERGLVHRDVKPSNVLISSAAGSRHCYLTDFGLAKGASERTAVNEGGGMVGTLDYIAPEQIEGGVVDGRADVYSLACLLYHLLTGEVPFVRESQVAVVYAHLEAVPPRVTVRRPDLPAELDEAVAVGMAKCAAERWETCGEFVRTARAVLADGALPARIADHRNFKRRVSVFAGAFGLFAVSLAAFELVGGRGAGVARADSVLRIDPAGGKVSGGVNLPGHPRAVTTCAGSVFVANRNGTVAEIDPRTSKFARIRVGGIPADISHIGGLATVVIGPPRERLTVIDSAFGGISDSIALPGPPVRSAVVTSFGRDVWIANPNAGALERVEPPYTGISRSIRLPTGARGVVRYTGIAAGEGAIWVAGGQDDDVWRVDPATRRVTVLKLGFAPIGIAAGYDGVWVVDGRGDEIVRLDPVTGRVRSHILVGRSPTAVALGEGSVWVANQLDASVSRIDPRRETLQRIGVGSNPIALAVGLGAVWVVKSTA
jgi:serine/threonine protein kinase/streptogramin lyase